MLADDLEHGNSGHLIERALDEARHSSSYPPSVPP